VGLNVEGLAVPSLVDCHFRLRSLSVAHRNGQEYFALDNAFALIDGTKDRADQAHREDSQWLK